MAEGGGRVKLPRRQTVRLSGAKIGARLSPCLGAQSDELCIIVDSRHEVCIIVHIIEVRQAPAFTAWLAKLRDFNAVARIVARLRRFELGNLGDVKPVGDGVREARIDHGPGYRLYFVKRGEVLVVMLCGGDKRTQDADIRRAKVMAKEI